MKKQRRRDVVGQIADDPQVVAERVEIEIEYIDRVQCEAICECIDEAGREIAVDLDGFERAGGGDQRARQRPKSGSDFDEALALLRIDCSDNRSDRGRVSEEILAEALAR